MNNLLHNISECCKRCFQKTQYKIIWDEHDVQVKSLAWKNRAYVVSFSWDSVLAVDSFKRDLFIVDCICLAFQTDDGWSEINEDMEGWDGFLKSAELKLPGFPPFGNWWVKVMLPPFETSHSRLWTRKAAE